LLSLPVRVPWVVVGVTLAITAVLGYFGARIRVDSAVENLLPEGNADRLYYEGVRKAFGSEEATVIGFFADDVFAPHRIATIDRLSRDLAKIDGVREVISLTTIKGVESDDFGLRVGTLMRELPRTPEAAQAFRAKILGNPLYVGNVASADGTAAALIVAFDLLSDEEFLDKRIEQQIHRVVETEVTDASFAISGIQTLKVMGAQLMEQDLARFVPLSVLLVFVVLAWSFRTVRGVVLPLASVLVGVTWTVGVMVLSGRDINMGTLVLPPLLMAVGIAYAIHVVSRYYHEIRPGRARADVITATLEHTRLPVAIASLTTLLGFATLILNPIRAIREFGTYSVFGIATIFLLAIFFLPALLMLLPDAQRRPAGDRDGGWVQRLLAGLGYYAIEHRWRVILAFLLACGLSVWAATRIRVETDYLSFFDPHGPVRADNTRIAEHLGGTQPIYVVIDGPKPRSLANLPVIDAIRDLQLFIAEQPGVDSSLSFADFVALVHKALNPDSNLPLPATESDLAQLLTFMSPDDLAPVVTKDFSRANILVRTRLSGSAEVNEFVRRVEDFARRRFRRDIGVHATGSVVLLNRSADTLSHNQVMGLAQVLVVLTVLMSLLFLSVRAGILSLVPNVVPIIILFGLMGACGISLNISTSMIAVIAIGIAVDDTIHYLTEFNAQIRRTGEQRSAVMLVGQTVGRPIVFTSIALFLGFLIVCLSNFKPIQHFGFLAGVTMLVALLADLLLLPALVMSTTIITLWDLLYVKLGPQPHKEIPLFQGLRPFQAKLVVLMARLSSAERGDHVTRRGEMKAELYVLLSGVVEVRRKDDEPVIRTMARGDVIGEMGLVRARPRSADVIVRDRTEYLVLDGGFLERIQRRYPRIAAKVFLNLTKILSDRLETTTDALAKR
jgi:predicted RND superfamily exporter protein